MRSKVIALCVLTVVVTPTVPPLAHHGTGVAYDTEKVVTLTGTGMDLGQSSLRSFVRREKTSAANIFTPALSSLSIAAASY